MITLFKSTQDWKRYLSAEDEARLNAILRNVARHRQAYTQSDTVKVAQLWCSVLEIQKQTTDLQQRLGRLESVFSAIAEKFGEAEASRKELTKSLEEF